VAATAVGVALLAQLTIGILTVVNGLPLSLAVMHNAGAAVLLLSVVALNHVVQDRSFRDA
jgi:cytochrome c oxidase assembly protein subunit 15